MDFVSLLITLLGLVLLVGLYAMSRFYQHRQLRNQGYQNQGKIPVLVDRKGQELSSILHDHPATDGSSPKVRQTFNYDDHQPEGNTKQSKTRKKDKNAEQNLEQQLVLFIAHESGIAGENILNALKANNFYLGDMDIFHYPSAPGKRDSLFRVANGVKPWTLRPKDIKTTTTPGLSLLLQLPSSINDKKAIKLFVDKSQRLAKALNAQLKNKSQRPFSAEDRKQMLSLVDK